ARYLITWPDGVIKNQWLQVTVKADASTGLTSPDVFYFGNMVGETGDRPGYAVVNSLDLVKVRRRLRGRTAGLAEPCDFNRDGRVNVLDLVIARTRSSRIPLRLLTAPYVDTVPPSVSIATPSDGSAVVGQVTVTASASDNVGLAGVQFLLDGAVFGPEDTAEPYTVDWDTTTAGDGAHQLMAIALDEAGNLGVSSSINVTVSNADTAPPSVTLTAPASGATVGALVTLSADASDNVGVSGVQFLVDGAAVG